jgi:DNA excision repair protein ERCC-2
VKSPLRVSVRGLVEHSLRSGDLDLEAFGLATPLEAIRAHQKLQASRPEGYRKEVPLSRAFAREGLVLEVHGRIDGVLERGAETVVEEIKTTRGDLEEVSRRENPAHWGQLRVYAFLYAVENGLETIDARLTYYQLNTGGSVEIERRFDIQQLRELTEGLAFRYLDWMAKVIAFASLRDASIASASFPFPRYRRGQREMAVAVYRAIREGRALLVQAPTGIGKTAAALFPALKALAEGSTERILYLTARTTGRALAESCLGDMRRQGVRLRSVTLTAKEKICFNPEKACNGEECDFARGFYERIDGAVDDAFDACDLSREAIESLARKHRVCPFELSLEIAPSSDVVICDYNYVFDPRVSLRGLVDEKAKGATLLVDEAHNLVDRAREMFSAEISRARFEELGRFFEPARNVASALSSGDLEPVLSALAGFLRQAEARSSVEEIDGSLRDLYFEAAWFTRVGEWLDGAYAVVRDAMDGDVRWKLFCRDPAPRLRERFSSAAASVLFSATLAPLDYFRRTLGLEDGSKALSLPSPFPSGNLRVLVAPSVATTYRRRAETGEALVRLLAGFVRARAGNYLFYFPSYAYLEAIHGRFAVECPEVAIAIQTREMSEAERARFLSRFDAKDGTFVGFATLGGFFGEAIDLPGDKLEGAAIVGVGLPALSPERDRIRERFESEGTSGFDYAYLYPGMNRVLQAAGRVIRSETDRGAVLLVDSRFGERRYRSLFPAGWTFSTVRSADEVRAELESFWSSR